MAHAMVRPMGYLTGQMLPWCAPWVSIFLQYGTVLGVLCVPRSISAIMCLTMAHLIVYLTEHLSNYKSDAVSHGTPHDFPDGISHGYFVIW